jgi:Family of unknown function (DUF6275)
MAAKSAYTRVEGSYQDVAEGFVTDYICAHLDKTDRINLAVYTVWSCWILCGWKCLVSSNLPDGMYYEVTYNSGKQEYYLDAYKKFENVVIPD